MSKGYEEKMRPSLWLWLYLAVSVGVVAAWLFDLALGRGLALPAIAGALLLPHPLFALVFFVSAARSRVVVRRDVLELVPPWSGAPKVRIPFKSVRAVLPFPGVWRAEKLMNREGVQGPLQLFPRGDVPGRWMVVYEHRDGRRALVLRGSPKLLEAIRECAARLAEGGGGKREGRRRG